MAKEIRSKNEKKVSKLIGLTLSGNSITLGQVNDEREQDAIFEYHVLIENVSVEDELLMFSCDLTIVKRYDEEGGAEIARFDASYFCGVSQASKSTAATEALAKQYAETSVWHSFSALAAVVTSQIRISFPVLPPTPNSVRVKKPEIEYSAASGD